MAHNWTRDEEILALSLYCRLSFGQMHARNKQVQLLANTIGRTPAAVSMKLCNFARFDPTLQARGVSGLKNGGRLDQEIWNEFCQNLDYLEQECQRIEKSIIFDEADGSPFQSFPIGDTVPRVVDTRIHQSFFRSAVLLSYNNSCCITGIALPSLLNASHIKPWAVSDPTTERTNPKNGLCLNALHDQAFDKGLITIDEDYRIIISHQIKDLYTSAVVSEYFGKYDGKKIELPYRFSPDKKFLKYHNSYIFIG